MIRHLAEFVSLFLFLFMLFAWAGIFSHAF
jgi:hypothetical protein